MEIRETSLLFGETEGEGPVTATTTIDFPRTVERVAVGIVGYSARYEDDEDHHLGRLRCRVSAAIDGSDDTKVNVTGSFLLRDWSNEIDDPYSGLVDLAVLADLVPVAPPAPGAARSDLVVTGMEITQVVQHFRTADHLAPPNVFPDNSIRLVARKPTLVRVYVDHDATSGLAPINELRGELTVSGNGTTTTLMSLENITPRRDASIDRGNRRHTLNFLISDTASRGSLDLSVVAIDANDATQFSRPFDRSASFETRSAMPVMAIGIKYTGDDTTDGATAADLAAPVQSDFVDTFEFTETVFPIPSVNITSYAEIEYDKDTKSDINDGCDKLSDLRDAVAELRGDADDLVYGLYNVGVDTGSVGGCGGGGAGVGRIGGQTTAAHEFGHAVGRDHAPCDNVVRCAEPKNQDGSYPNYVGFDSDSIGEYGADPLSTLGDVKDPAVAHDFMGYSGSRWVSPYTYKALMSAVPDATSGASAAFAKSASASSFSGRFDGEWVPIAQEKLFLRLDIDREGIPTLHPSFHFPARPRPVGKVATDHSIEFHDRDGTVLSTTCLRVDDVGCGCSGGCGDETARPPLRIRQPVAFPDAACQMVLYRCDERIAEWWIPDPPRVEVEVQCVEHDHVGSLVAVRWKATQPRSGPRKGAANGDAHRVRPWALLQWRDRKGVWRGCALRTSEQTILVPRGNLGPIDPMHLRVLVTTGVATGVGEWQGSCDDDDRPMPPPPPVLVLGGARVNATRTNLGASASVAVTGDQSQITGTIRWHDARGGELARGRRLPASALAAGQHVIRASVVGSTNRVATEQWLVEKTPEGELVLLQGNLQQREDLPPIDERGDPADRHRSRGNTHQHDHDHDHDEGSA